MKFLIDECLHPTLSVVAERRGHEATHVCHRGMSGWRDDNVVRVAVDESFALVTNNARDFRRLHAMEEAHAGLVILLPFVPPARQQDLFAAALDAIGSDGDLFNQLIEVDFIEDEVEITQSALALDE